VKSKQISKNFCFAKSFCVCKKFCCRRPELERFAQKFYNESTRLTIFQTKLTKNCPIFFSESGFDQKILLFAEVFATTELLAKMY
jgi:hypothetical protein